MQPPLAADYDVVIIGGGAAGLSAAIYTSRASMRTLILDSIGCGGQILTTDVIENYPGFPDGIKGPDLSIAMCTQAKKFGAAMEHDQVLEVGSLDQAVKQVTTYSGTISTRTLIITAGGSPNKLGVPGELELAGRGVSYCAVCDGNFFRGQEVVVVGGGDAALDEGLYLSNLASKVTLVHRRDELRAKPISQERVRENPKFKFLYSHVVEEVLGSDGVEAVKVKDLKTGENYDYPTSAVFIYIGFHSNTGFLGEQVPTDAAGHIYTNIDMESRVPGVFAAGDIRASSFRQLGTAVGDGITAALAAYRYLNEG